MQRGDETCVAVAPRAGAWGATGRGARRGVGREFAGETVSRPGRVESCRVVSLSGGRRSGRRVDLSGCPDEGASQPRPPLRAPLVLPWPHESRFF